ncbi:MAG TPA: AI-2E family transporter, partial [Crenalkalicoccus sp.]|nr:AI-2E family transporter [Crenalkalicoccus sp.]
MSDPTPLPRRGLHPAGTSSGSALATLQVGLIVVAILYFARDLLIPLVLAVLLSFVLAPLARLLRRAGLPRVAGVLLAVLVGFALLTGVGTLVGQQITQLAGNLPGYQYTISRKLAGLQVAGGLVDRINGTLAEMGRSIRPAEPQSPPPASPSADPQPEEPKPVPVVIRTQPPTAFEVVEQVAQPMLGPLATAGFVLILVIFILLYREDLRDRLIRLAGARDLHRTMAAMDDAAYRLSRYFLAQTGLNAGFGLFIAAGLWLIGIPNPLLWGVIAGLMRFVPFIGSWIAALFPVLLALAVDPSWTSLVAVLLLFGLTEPLMGQVFEPLLYGHSTGLSPFAVIAAATFWTWLWGPIGLLLSVPLTVCLVVLGRHVDRLEFLEVMLGSRPPLDPEETFYQRALAGDVDALVEQAERRLREKPLPAYLDEVALPALRLAQEDVVHGVLTPERQEVLRASIETLTDDLADAEEPAPPESEAPPALPVAWQAPGAVLCLPGRGPFDPVLAAVFGHLLTRRGFGVQVGGGAAGP